MTISTHDAHDQAMAHPIYLKGVEAAAKAVVRERGKLRTQAEKLEEKASAMLAQASELRRLAEVYQTYGTPLKAIEDAVEGAAYWRARKVVAEAAGGETVPHPKTLAAK